MKFRALLYALARFLGDLGAVSKGKTGKRVARRLVGKSTGKGVGKLFK